MTKIHFMYFDAGGGHRSAVNALQEVIAHEGKAWDVEAVHVQHLLDSLDIFRKVSGIRLEDCYNLMLKKGWTLGSPQLTRMMQAIIRFFHRDQVRMLADFWSNNKPDMVVSVVPNLNRAMYEGLRRVSQTIPYVNILTDIADYPPHFWMEKGQQQHFICGSEKAVEQARALGYPKSAIHRASGMILSPRFYNVPDVDRAAERQRLGLDPDLPTGLVMFGGQGSSVMREIATRADAQLIAICGKNEKLAASLRQMKRGKPMFVEGFTREVPYYMRLADFFVGKPGPGSISEALAMGLPVIIERNAWTLPQERYNTEWVLENGYGVVLPSFRGIDGAVAQLLEPGNFAKYKSNVQKYCNRAVFEIPEILERILSGS
jgi:1,2-diacylglycerol 3-beta-galactosyltransferase